MLKHFIELPCCGCEWEYQGDLYKDGDTETVGIECWDCGAEVDVTFKINISHKAKVIGVGKQNE